MPVKLTISAHLDFKALRERVDHGCAYAVQPAGDGIRLAAELAARMEGSHDRFHSRHAGCGVNIHRDATPIVLNPHRAIRLDVYGDTG